MFIVSTILSLAGLAVLLTYPQFTKGREGIDRSDSGDNIKQYLSELSVQFIGFFESWNLKRVMNFLSNRFARKNRGWTEWIVDILWGCTAFLVLSGFFYAFFIHRGLSGLPLLLHVVVGGIFAVCLSGAVLINARFYSLGSIPRIGNDVHVPQSDGPEGPALNVRILFWLMVFSGLSLILTALASMLSFFPLSAQEGLIAVHRYSALAGLLSSIAFIHCSSRKSER